MTFWTTHADLAAWDRLEQGASAALAVFHVTVFKSAEKVSGSSGVPPSHLFTGLSHRVRLAKRPRPGASSSIPLNVTVFRSSRKLSMRTTSRRRSRTLPDTKRQIEFAC
jgi:hypothetical protein